MQFFTYDAEGTIVSAGVCQPEVLALYSVNGLTAVEGEADPLRHYYDIATGTVRDLDSAATLFRRGPPPRGFRWTRTGLIDERTLADAKLDKWAEIKRARDAVEHGGFTAGAYQWDSDLESQQAMSLALQDMAAAGGPATVNWTTKINEVVTLNLTQMRALVRACRAHIQTQRDKAATLRAQIQAATTKGQVDAIQW